MILTLIFIFHSLYITFGGGGSPPIPHSLLLHIWLPFPHSLGNKKGFYNKVSTSCNFFSHLLTPSIPYSFMLLTLLPPPPPYSAGKHWNIANHWLQKVSIFNFLLHAFFSSLIHPSPPFPSYIPSHTTPPPLHILQALS